MADQKPVLPPLSTTPVESTAAAPLQIQFSPDVLEGPTSKDLAIGGGVMLAAAIIFFVIRNAYVNYLVGSLKRSPNNAGLAGWGLFGGLFFGSAIGCLAIVGKSLMQIMYIAPLGALSVVCFVLMALVSSKK